MRTVRKCEQAKSEKKVAKRDQVPGLAAKLKAARERSGLTQEQVAEAASVSRASLSQYESGSKTPTLAVIYKLAAAYGVKATTLLPPDDEVGG